MGVTVAIGGRPHTHDKGFSVKVRIRVLVATAAPGVVPLGQCCVQPGRPGFRSVRGTLELGYQIGFPWSLGVGINFSYTTPNILIDHGNFMNAFAQIIIPNLFPSVSISADLGDGPSIQEVATFSVDVSGPHGKVAVSNAHGTVTGAAGGVLLRPFARL
ncbi:MAG: MspA protein, partial [Mycobacterium sp.]|nr:MspA protein [Mycobacterium sp.]